MTGPLTERELRELLSRYQALGVVSALAPVAGGFSGAVVVRVTAEAGEWCLRGWPPASLARERLLGLHRLLSVVHGAGVEQVPVPICDTAGRSLVFAGDRWWQVEPWMPGRADFHAAPSAERLENALACLAAFHRAAAKFDPVGDEIEWFASSRAGTSPAVRERLERITRWQPAELVRLRQALEWEFAREWREPGLELVELFEQCRPTVEAGLKAALVLPVPLQPCLRDIWHDHVLFEGELLTGLIDLGACRTESVAADLARLLGSLLADDGDWTHAITAYQRHRPMTVEELGLVPVLDQSAVLLGGLYWLERRFLHDDRSVDGPRILDRLLWWLARSRRLAARLT
ncbi:MAG: phosphotransferase [Planctomycetes bacterium]|nr:phosphotransferase [Planctomycetota bacterium]